MEPATTGARLAHFRILGKLGQGGMGVVYRARDEHLGRVVALKVLKPKAMGARQRKARFLREARSAAAISHPCIAAVYEVGEDDDTVFIAMELIEGQTLRELCGGGPLPLADALPLALAIADGMGRAHHAGIVHRDLKPDNIMVTPDRQVKILDFGLAKLHQPPGEEVSDDEGDTLDAAPTLLRTREGLVFGTPGYMSPEQVRGLQVDQRSDIFSFGVILHEMVTAVRPHVGATEMDTMASIMREPATPPSAVDSSLPAELDWVVGKCLEKIPEDRYQTCADLLVDLRRLVRDSVAPSRSRAPAEAVSSPAGPVAHRAAMAARGDRGGRRTWRAIAAAIALIGATSATVWSLSRRRQTSATAPPPAATVPTSRDLPAEREYPSKRLTANPPERGLDSVAVSPDGRLIVYTTRRRAYLRIVGTEDEQELALPEGMTVWSANWFPDGTRLVVTSPKGGRWSVWSVPILGGSPVKIRDDGWAAAVSPDGKWIASVSERGMELVSSSGGESRTLYPARPGQLLDNVTWSPDSERVAFSRHSGEVAEILSVPLDGTSATVLLQDPRLRDEVSGLSSILWLSDGRMLYGLYDGPDKMTVLTQPIADERAGLDGPPSRVLRLEGEIANWFSATSDARTFVYLRVRTQDEVFVGSLVRGGKGLAEPVRLTADRRNDYPGDWSLDSGMLYFTSDRRGGKDIFQHSFSDGKVTPVVLGPVDEVHPQVSPDGTHMYFLRGPSQPEARWQLARVALPGGSANIVAGPTGSASSIAGIRCGSTPGAVCVISTREGDTTVLRVLDPTPGEYREIARIEGLGRGQSWDLSSDGRRIVAVTVGGHLSIRAVAGGAPTELPTGLSCQPQDVSWSADNRAFFVTCIGGDAPYQLVHVAADGKFTTLWHSDDRWVFAPLPSPDGKRLAFGVHEIEQDAWATDVANREE